MRTQENPECRWVPVVDGSGRRRLEMRWQLPVAEATSVAGPLSRAA
ncbi:hypothetical protein [Blastococcus sp. CCUG 61487]|nr:hypothetical protein [Blastococcus sp. CCUG 61487]